MWRYDGVTLFSQAVRTIGNRVREAVFLENHKIFKFWWSRENGEAGKQEYLLTCEHLKLKQPSMRHMTYNAI